MRADGFDAKFPSPLEVDRVISGSKAYVIDGFNAWFPSPLEVDRFISIRFEKYRAKGLVVSVPSRGR